MSKLKKRSKESIRRPSIDTLKKITHNEGIAPSILSIIKNMQNDIEQKIEKYKETIKIINLKHLKKIKQNWEVLSEYLLKPTQPEIHKTPSLKKRQKLLTQHQSKSNLMIIKLNIQSKKVMLSLAHLKHEITQFTAIYEDILHFEKHWFNDIKKEKRAL